MPAQSFLLWLPLAILLGALVSGTGARLRFARAPDAFRCKSRFPGDPGATLPPWPRHRTHARWVHDVLLVQWGVLVPHTVSLAVCGTDRALRRTSRLEVSGLGGDPVVLTLVLDDGRVVEVAARSRDRMALAGPYLVAAISALPG